MSKYRTINPDIVAEYHEPTRIKVAKWLSWLPAAFVGMGAAVGVADVADFFAALALPAGLFGGVAIMAHGVHRGRIVQN